MKKILIIFLVFLPLVGWGANITSNPGGGNWNSGSTWVGSSVPGPTDNAIIATTGTSKVTVNVPEMITNVTINNGATLNSTSTLTISGLLAISTGGTMTGADSYRDCSV